MGKKNKVIKIRRKENEIDKNIEQKTINVKKEVGQQILNNQGKMKIIGIIYF